MDHSIVFSGRIREDMTLSEVRANFARLFKLNDESRLDQYFSGRPVVIKKGLSPEDAEKYAAILHKAGALCEVRSNAPAPHAPTPAAGGNFAAVSTPAVPEASPAPQQNAPYANAPVGGGRQATPGARAQAPNSSGMPDAVLPQQAAGLCWGGFFFNWIWGLCHGSFLGLLMFVPIIGWVIVPFYYLFKGREIAWRKRRWRSVEEFNSNQRYWSIAGVTLVVLTAVLMYQGIREFQRVMRVMTAANSAQREQDLSQISDPQEREQMHKLYAQADVGRLAASPNPSPERDQAREQVIAQAPDEHSKEVMRQMYRQIDAMNAAMKPAMHQQ